jgi:mono/diheme cytochrome c family protein
MIAFPITLSVVRRVVVLAAFLGAVAATARALELHAERSSPFDLAVRGLLRESAPGAERFIRWPELRALPCHTLTLTAEFFPGDQVVTVLYLEDLWAALPVAGNADVLLASCADGYASVFRREFIRKDRPFLVLEINGLGPDRWPPPGLKFNPAPYVISVAATVAPEVATLLDANHKKPWGVTTIEVARFADAFAGAGRDRWARISDRAAAGRTIWINSCASCHQGPGGIFGGTKSGQPFAVLEAIARSNPDFFRLYVRHPTEANPAGTMEAHPHYTDAQLAELIAFVTAEPAP